MIQKVIGSTVLLGAAAASISSFLYFNTLFEQTWQALICSCFYFLIISNFDRSLFAISNRWLALIRIFILLLITLITSICLEVKLLEEDLKKQELQRHQNKLAVAHRPIDVLEGEKRVQLNQIDKELIQVQKELREAKQMRAAEDGGLILSQSGQSSSGVKGKGKRWRAYNQQVLSLEQSIGQLQTKKEEIENRYLKEITIKENQFQQRKVAPTQSFLSQYIALKDLLNSSDSKIKAATKEMSYGIKIFVFLLEVFPVILKLFMGKTLYQYEVDQQDLLVAEALTARNALIRKQITDLYNAELTKDYNQEEIEKRINELLQIIHHINTQYNYVPQ